jgi:hypothetical protein
MLTKYINTLELKESQNYLRVMPVKTGIQTI